MTTCRVCGAEVGPEELLGVEAGGGCRRCNGSPACTRCGHPRRQHRGTFATGPARCEARVPVEASAAAGRCGCESYTADPLAFSEATPIVDVIEPRLRRPGEAPADAPRLAPVRDLFDSGRPLRDMTEFDGVPWRPPK